MTASGDIHAPRVWPEHIRRRVCAGFEAVIAARGDARRLATVFADSPLPMVLVDARRRYVDANQPARLWFRLSLEEIRLLLRARPADRAATERLREVAEQKLPVLREAIERAEIVRGWLEDAARCYCPTLDDCPLFEDPVRLPERSLVLRSLASSGRSAFARPS